MIPIKIQCGCGQRYAFDVEPVDGRMSGPVACPACGADGTPAANEMIAQAVPAPAEGAPAPRARLRVEIQPAPSAEQHPRPAVLSPLPLLTPEKLAWYEQVWIALPIALVAVGGAIGGGCGGLAFAANRAVFKKTRHPVLRYVWTGLISLSAVVVWLMVASFILALIKRH